MILFSIINKKNMSCKDIENNRDNAKLKKVNVLKTALL